MVDRVVMIDSRDVQVHLPKELRGARSSRRGRHAEVTPPNPKSSAALGDREDSEQLGQHPRAARRSETATGDRDPDRASARDRACAAAVPEDTSQHGHPPKSPTPASRDACILQPVYSAKGVECNSS